MTPRRLKSLLLLGGLLLGGLVLLGWTQTWYSIDLTSGQSLEVAGDAAAPALAALALSALALGAALAIAGPVFRVVLGVLEVAIGGLVIYSAAAAVADPVLASASSITAATGVSGVISTRELVSVVGASVWPVLTLGAGIALVAAGILVVVTSSRWPASSRRYQTARFAAEDGTRGAVSDWDSLSEGHDPTQAGASIPLESTTDTTNGDR